MSKGMNQSVSRAQHSKSCACCTKSVPIRATKMKSMSNAYNLTIVIAIYFCEFLPAAILSSIALIVF